MIFPLTKIVSAAAKIGVDCNASVNAPKIRVNFRNMLFVLPFQAKELCTSNRNQQL
jgi:hypothetical protein